MLYHVLLDDAGKLRLDPDGSVAWRIASRIARALDGRPRDLVTPSAGAAAAAAAGGVGAAENSATALVTTGGGGSGTAGDVNATDPAQILERRDLLPPGMLFIRSGYACVFC